MSKEFTEIALIYRFFGINVLFFVFLKSVWLGNGMREIMEGYPGYI